MKTEFFQALIGSVVGLIITRLEDKFYNRQYTKKEYVKVFCLCYLASLTTLLVINHILLPNLPSQQTGGSVNSSSLGTSNSANTNTSFKDIHKFFNPNTGGAGNSNTMKFQTGTPNF